LCKLHFPVTRIIFFSVSSHEPALSDEKRIRFHLTANRIERVCNNLVFLSYLRFFNISSTDRDAEIGEVSLKIGEIIGRHFVTGIGFIHAVRNRR
jgi:hypothetical protein